LNEKSLIEGLVLGDPHTYKTLVDQFQVPVRNICAGIITNRHEAEDLAQEVFVEVFRSVGNFRGDSKLSTWIYRIAVNKSLNHKRKQKRQMWLDPFGIFLSEEKSPYSADPENLPSQNIENQQRMQHLHKALDTLPENQRTAFVLNKYEDLSYKEISEVMNMTLSGVESLIHRAKVNLQKKLWDCFKKDCI